MVHKIQAGSHSRPFDTDTKSESVRVSKCRVEVGSRTYGSSDAPKYTSNAFILGNDTYAMEYSFVLSRSIGRGLKLALQLKSVDFSERARVKKTWNRYLTFTVSKG